MLHTSEYNLSKLSVLQRQRQALLLSLIRRAAREIVKDENGLCLQFPKRQSTWMILAEFINLERLCDPTLTYRLELELSNEQVYLKVTGEPEALEALQHRWLSG